MLRTLALTIALASLFACGATSTPSAHGDGGDASSGSSSGTSGSSSGGGTTADASDGSAPSCVSQSCSGGCCAGTYCWGFSSVCLQNGTCSAAGVDTPTPGLCSCDGFSAGSCPAGEVCPPPAHGHATYCTPSDGGAGDAGTGAAGSPCGSDSQCAGGLCLGGAFAGGYCTNAVSECDPGLCVNASVSCEGYGSFQDVDGGALATPEICPALCQTQAECRSGYECCHSNAGSAGLACLPPSVCGDQ